MIALEETKEIRRRLKNAWVPFFSRFGKLTPIQIQAIPEVLERQNVILASPTASGKTEAVVAPLAERCLNEGWKGISVLYVVPTRALANDTIVRIEEPLREMGLSTALKHGDQPSLPRVLPNWLITTPESLDSLICRRSKMISSLRSVILDEIHLIDNTYRGDQLRILLRRLRDSTNDERLSVYLLSATLSDPKEVADRYTSDCKVITAGENRGIKPYYVRQLEDLRTLSRRHHWKKLLCFCNLRESVENLAARLDVLWRPYPVVAHHGSLSRRLREDAEATMKGSKVALCVATSTLEIGIDIGDIDAIVIAEVPWSLSSLLQRLGRGNRRGDLIHAVAVLSSHEEEVQIREMFRMASDGGLPKEEYIQDPSVAIQQCFSYLFQHPGGVSERELIELVSELCSEASTLKILANLREKDWIVPRGTSWFATEKLMDLGTVGMIHSNIPDSRPHRVIDIQSGNEIGIIGGMFDEVFILGGRRRKVVSVLGGVVHVRSCPGAASPADFRRHPRAGAFSYLLPRTL